MFLFLFFSFFLGVAIWKLLVPRAVPPPAATTAQTSSSAAAQPQTPSAPVATTPGNNNRNEEGNVEDITAATSNKSAPTTTTKKAALTAGNLFSATTAAASSSAATVAVPMDLSKPFPKRVLIAYATQKGTARQLAHRLFSSFIGCRYPDTFMKAPAVLDMADVDVDTLHADWDLVIFVCSTYTGGTPPESVENFTTLLQDMSNDFRVPRDHFAPISAAAKKRKQQMASQEGGSCGPSCCQNADDDDNDEKDKKEDAPSVFAADAGGCCSQAAAQEEQQPSAGCCGGGGCSASTAPASSSNSAAQRHPPQFAIFGLGDLVYGDNFNKFAHNMDHWIRSLGGKTITPSVYASEARTQPLFAIFIRSVLKFVDKKWLPKYERWTLQQNGGGAANGGEDFEDGLDISSIATSRGKSSKAPKATMLNPDAPLESDSGAEKSEDDDDDDDEEGNGDGADIEDIVEDSGRKQQLLYPRLRNNLTKQGYQVIGSHSAVKLCRWTKSMLRGRGGCYKHTFYNISSFQCMEMTPSLACANKCVFCWRHHTNPVGKSFTWEMDSPEFLVDAAIQQHRQMIKQMKGVPGVQPDRFAEAMNIKHCALSLVGEPIMYPEINKFLGLLHEHHISTFMVTNAQFPDRIEQLSPVTQLYLSIDAPTKEELKRIDRPIFEDFWERCLGCIDALSLKRQRTVFRLTLVNDYNTTNIDAYAQMVRKGNPDFIEVKGVTYCGTSDASSLTMKHVPFHEEVVKFCVDLCNAIGGDGMYEIACEHEHSCCMLIARKNFRINGIWHTWIDYEKFFELCESGKEDFTALDYAAPTPAWAVFNSDEKGFDPKEVRHRRNKPITNGC